MSNRLRGAVSLLFLVAVVAAPASAGWFDWFKLPFTVAPCGGFTLISATPLSIISPSENLSGKSTTLYVVANCGGESVDVIQRDALSSLLGIPVGTDIQIGIKQTEEVNTYPILNEGISSYTYTSVARSCNQQEYPGGPYGNYCPAWSTNPTYAWHTDCHTDRGLVERTVGTLGSLAAPSSRASAILTITIGDKTSEVKIGTMDSAVELFTPDGDSIGSAMWLGSLVTGQALPSEANYGAFYDRALPTPKWKVITTSEKLAYITAQAATIAAIASVPPGVSSDWRHLSECYGQIYAPSGAMGTSSISSSAAGNLMASTAQLGTAPIGNAALLDGASVPFAVVGKINNPTILIRVKADLLNLQVPVGVPAIVSAALAPFGVGEYGKLEVGIKNVGNSSGSFSLELGNCQGLAAVSPPYITLPVGGSGSLSLVLSSPVQAQGACGFSVCDVPSQACVSSSVQLQITPTKLCIPNSVEPRLVQRTDVTEPVNVTTGTELVLQKCSADGMGWNTILSCDVGSLVYQPTLKPFPWACTKLKNCPSGASVLPVTETAYIPKINKTFTGAIVASVGTSPNGCSYLCENIFDEGTARPPTGVDVNLLTCGDATPLVEKLVEWGTTQKLVRTPVPTFPPVKNQSGAGTAGMCKVDNDCLYVGEGCVTGVCQKKEGIAALPGFEAVFAVAGLLAVAYWVRRRTDR